jgi:shikimate dehydrogenase
VVNTVFVKDGRYIGENTDGKGFVRTLRDASITFAGKTVTMLGAGAAPQY